MRMPGRRPGSCCECPEPCSEFSVFFIMGWAGLVGGLIAKRKK